MDTAVQGLQHTVTFEWPRNPYPGLRPFREDEALTFYGRNSHKDEVLARLNDSQLVFVTGPSGCGKSSLIKAGVLPALQAGLLTKAGYRWTTLQMRPGRRPLASLAAAFKSLEPEAGADLGHERELESILQSEDSGLWVAADSVAPLHDAASLHKGPVRSLLLIDQFEEIFGEQIQDPADVDRFVRLLVRFADRPHPNLFIIVTLRSDYLGQCANFEGLAESINRTQFLTPVLTQDELSQAIARPAEDYNGEVEPQLVEQIIRDMRTGTAYHPDSLPLMQHALLWMWTKAWKNARAAEPPRPPFDDEDHSTKLTLKVYQDNGGIAGILDRHAEDVLDEAVGESKDRRKIAETVFRRLSERDAEGRYRRSPASTGELCNIAGCQLDDLQQIIRPFEHPDVCFLEQRPSEGTDEVLVDVSHESLIRQWNRAKSWADAEAEKVRKFRELAHAALTWEKRNRSHHFLKRRGELEVIHTWWEDEDPHENWTRRYVLGPEGSKLADTFPCVQEYLRVSSDTDLAEQKAVERAQIERASERSRRQRDRYLAVAVFMLLTLTFVGGLLIWQTKQYDAYRVRVAALLADEALKVFGPARALLAVMEGIGDHLPELPEIKRVAYRTLAQLRDLRILDDHGAQVRNVEFAPHQPLLLTVSQNGLLRFWNLGSGELIDEYRVGGRFLIARWTPDGKELYVSARGINTHFVVPCSHEKLRPYFSECGSATEDRKRSFNQEVGAGSFSPDGRWVVTGSFNMTTRLWDVASLDTPKKDFGQMRSFMMGGAFSHDSQRLALATVSGEIRVYRMRDILEQDGTTAETELKPRVPPSQAGGLQATEPQALVNSLAFHPKDSNILLATYRDGTARLWDIAKHDEKQLRSERSLVYQGVFNHDGDWVATAHEDRVVRLWPLRAADPVPQVLRGHGGAVLAVDYSPDGKTIVSGSNDRTARLWYQQPALGQAKANATAPFSQSPSGKVSVRKSAGAGADRLILSYNNSDYELTAPLGFGEPVAAAVSPSGKEAVIAPKNGRPYLFNLASSENIVALPGRPFEWRQIGFLRDPTPPAGASAERIIGITQSGEAYSWPYFSDLQTLKEFAANQLPFVGKQRMQIREEVACRIKAKPEAECISTQDIPASE
jgi:WD40 repeat protein